ncbi:ubiquitin-conjugating enzyme protein [Rutstroemia sp. NJR-2017a WRK4]|nr:ubiquitin-conjugating enzyme protein [Rutstroemia sp. NJR-2017a WRK4]
MAARRISKELLEVNENPIEGITVSLLKEDDIHQWKVEMAGPPNTPYAGGKFELHVALPKDYPFKPPVVNFVTRIYHPNVTFDEKGSICVDVLKQDNWKPSHKVSAILGAIRNLLAVPNPDDPLENAIAEKFKTSREEYDKEAAATTRKYAMGR